MTSVETSASLFESNTGDDDDEEDENDDDENDEEDEDGTFTDSVLDAVGGKDEFKLESCELGFEKVVTSFDQIVGWEFSVTTVTTGDDVDTKSDEEDASSPPPVSKLKEEEEEEEDGVLMVIAISAKSDA